MYPLLLSIAALLGISFYSIYPIKPRLDTCVSLQPQYRLYAGQTTLDEASNGTLGDTGWSPPCSGCTPYKFLMLSKHGVRYLHQNTQWDIVVRLSNILDDLRQSGGSAPGSLCEEDWQYLQSWTPLLEPSNSERLAFEGWKASVDLAKRYKQRYPTILGRVYNVSDGYEFVHNDMTYRGNATVDTANAFITGLFGSSVGVITNQTRYPDTLLEYYNFCQKYLYTVPNVPYEYTTFVEGPWMQGVLRTMEIRLGLNPGNLTLDDASAMYDSCRSEYSTRAGNAPWCVMFREEDAEVMEYALDLYDYYRHGYGYDINYEQACNLFAEIVKRTLDATSTTYKVHGWWVLPEAFDSLVAHLGLWAEDEPLTAEGFSANKDREWRSSRHGAMGSNLVFVVHNDTSTRRVSMQVFHNEHIIKLPICQTTTCTETEIRTGWELDASSCNFLDICSWPRET